MGREPFTSPAERTAQAMRKMTPGALAGASRISTPGRTPSRAKRIPTTAPLTPPSTVPQYLATNLFGYDGNWMGLISTNEWVCPTSPPDVTALYVELTGEQVSGNPLMFWVLAYDGGEGPESLVPSIFFEGGAETYKFIDLDYGSGPPLVTPGVAYYFMVSGWDIGTGLGPAVFNNVSARVHFNNTSGLTETVTWNLPS